MTGNSWYLALQVPHTQSSVSSTPRPRRRRRRAGRARRVAVMTLVVGLAMLAAAASALAALPSNCTRVQDSVTCKFAYTGSEQTLVVPAGVHHVRVAAIGGAGGHGDSTAPGGAGGTAGQRPARDSG